MTSIELYSAGEARRLLYHMWLSGDPRQYLPVTNKSGYLGNSNSTATPKTAIVYGYTVQDRCIFQR